MREYRMFLTDIVEAIDEITYECQFFFSVVELHDHYFCNHYIYNRFLDPGEL